MKACKQNYKVSIERSPSDSAALSTLATLWPTTTSRRWSGWGHCSRLFSQRWTRVGAWEQ
jgi:hypothetical protein